MEEILQQILKRFDHMDQKFDSIDNSLVSINNRLSAVEEGQKSLLSEQGEMRKEVAFYYGSLMKKLDETKIELSSELKHVSHIQKQHQDV